MNIGQSIFLGALQGFTEFLPVSSSGHLSIAQKVLGIDEPALLFDTFLHGGTLLAALVVLWTDIWKILCHPIQKLTGFLILATAVTTVFAFVLQKTVSETGQSILENAMTSSIFLGCAFLITSSALFISEKLSRRGGIIRNKDDFNWKDALFIGFMQGIGILPGISRSGFTISGALGLKIEREFATKFSFLLAIPAVLGALLLQLKDLFHEGNLSMVIEWPPVIAGTFTAAITGFLSVKFMLNIIRHKTLYGFSVWTAMLGIGILFDALVTKWRF